MDNFKKSDFIKALILGETIALFLLPTLWQVNLLSKFPFLFWLLPMSLPFLSVLGLFFFFILSRKLPILSQIGRYGLVGTANTAIDFGILNLLAVFFRVYSGFTIFGLDLISFSLATLHSFAWNKFWTFESKERKVIIKEFSIFLGVTTVAILLNALIVYLITTFTTPVFALDEKQWLIIAKVFATIFSAILNFLGYKFIVFKKDESGALSKISTPDL